MAFHLRETIEVVKKQEDGVSPMYYKAFILLTIGRWYLVLYETNPQINLLREWVVEADIKPTPDKTPLRLDGSGTKLVAHSSKVRRHIDNVNGDWLARETFELVKKQEDGVSPMYYEAFVLLIIGRWYLVSYETRHPDKFQINLLQEWVVEADIRPTPDKTPLLTEYFEEYLNQLAVDAFSGCAWRLGKIVRKLDNYNYEVRLDGSGTKLVAHALKVRLHVDYVNGDWFARKTLEVCKKQEDGVSPMYYPATIVAVKYLVQYHTRYADHNPESDQSQRRSLLQEWIDRAETRLTPIKFLFHEYGEGEAVDVYWDGAWRFGKIVEKHDDFNFNVRLGGSVNGGLVSSHVSKIRLHLVRRNGVWVSRFDDDHVDYDQPSGNQPGGSQP